MSADLAPPTPQLPRLLATPGEPAGIGPELLVQLANSNFPAQLIVIADQEHLAATARRIQVPLTLLPTTLDAARQPHTPGTLQILHHPLVHSQVIPGSPLTENAATLIAAIELATEACLEQRADALITGPLDKAIINRAGIAFTGHTELLGDLTQTADPVMLLAASELKVALLTTHLPLRQVPAAVTAVRLEKTLAIIHREIQRLYQIASPRIAVCGLNPHAGDGGYLGDEEQQIIQPVLDKLRRQGMSLRGPLSADSAFSEQALSRCDLVLAMYHDQGLPVLKRLAGQDAVNITLGLPIIRVSVDHGTAYNLAGSGKADPASMDRAIRTAIEFCNH
ncbi:MAG: 4-hydroxythreonine-4-phosphate dehydrogenase PdxA [Rhodobacteraceae bacterium]|nr:4-hydroxythreonine-4-phosphate dehydrogenase PdxA [Paracoccaceae bacterium]